MARRDVLCISASRSDSVVILVQPGKIDAREIIRLAGELQAVIAEMLPEISVSVGIGRPHRKLIDLRQSYYEASYAIKIRKLKGEPSVIASFDDLGSYGLLLGLQDTLSLEVFYDSVLGKLQDYDEQNSSDLVKSLACFLEANGHWGDAAEKLYVHRHTLRYRMKRVEEITGRDLNQSQDRMEFWLALKAKELIDQSKKGKPAPLTRLGRRCRPASSYDVTSEPLSTAMLAPVRPSVSRQKRTAAPMSPGATSRSVATLAAARRVAARCSSSSRSTGPGATPQTRTPSGAQARASSLTRWISAALAAPCAAKVAQGCSPR